MVISDEEKFIKAPSTKECSAKKTTGPQPCTSILPGTSGLHVLCVDEQVVEQFISRLVCSLQISRLPDRECSFLFGLGLSQRLPFQLLGLYAFDALNIAVSRSQRGQL